VAIRAAELLIKALYFGHTALWRRALRRARRDEAMGLFFASLSESLGGAFLKIAQLLSARGDLLPPAVIDRLRPLRDQVPPFKAMVYGADRAALLPPLLHGRLTVLDARPVAAASVAQVHRGRMDDGRLVAVKLRRPGLAARLHTDLVLAAALARLAGKLPALRAVPIEALLEEVNRTIDRQIDFGRELAMGARFHSAFAARRDITIPRLYPELSGESCLVSDFIDGLMPLSAGDLEPAARERAATAAVTALFQMVFDEGLIHCDMHPGNLFCRRDGSLVLLDFGFVCELSDADRAAFTEFFFAFASGDGRGCSRVVVDTALALPAGFNRGAFDAAMIDLISRHHAVTAEAFEVARFAVELFDTQRRFRVTGSTAFTMTIIAFLVLEGMVKTLHPSMDFQAEARRFFSERQSFPQAL
jgi:ubiquinone biosynthesis protein